jgi:serine protease Do
MAHIHINVWVAMIRLVLCACLLAPLAACADTQQPIESSHQGQPPQPVGRALPDFTSLVAEYGDAVVNVEVQQSMRRSRSPRGAVPNDPFFEFFRRFGIPAPDFGGDTPGRRGAASGFIVADDGYILTNAHVVAGADTVTVRLNDRREFEAKVIGADARTDVALIKIDAKDLPTVKIGDPDEMKTGQWVLAIGSPFGLENSVTAGIVSATSRSVGGESYVPFIQTDVAVNPGNSGGPLFNLDGEVIGINSMIFSRTGGYMGLSFAIPIDVAMNVREQLVKTGRVVRSRIGVMVQDLDAQLAQSFGLDRPRGALVSSVEDDGPAAKAGVKPGDVIVGVNGEPIDRFSELSGIIAGLKPGSEAELRVWRDRKEHEIEVRVEELQDEPARLADSGEPGGKLGLSVRPLTPEEKRRVDTDGSVVVEDVGSPATEAGVRRGDVILGVNGTSIDSIRDLRETVEDASETVALLIERGQVRIFIPVPTG